jgi:hypothetical protein
VTSAQSRLSHFVAVNHRPNDCGFRLDVVFPAAPVPQVSHDPVPNLHATRRQMSSEDILDFKKSNEYIIFTRTVNTNRIVEFFQKQFILLKRT